MAKSKTPFFSIGSRGTVGGSLTTQKRGSATLLRSKPVPTDPYSLAQAYQRWDYKDYAYLWTLLTNSEKQVYRTKASRYHITGFSQWMRENLKTLPGIAGRWHLDERSGAIAYDSSKQSNNGTIIGASPITGVIAGGYYFDGINDEINCGNDPTLQLVDNFTLIFFIKPLAPGVNADGVGKYTSTAPSNGFTLYRDAINKFRFLVAKAGVATPLISDDIYTAPIWHCVAGRRTNGINHLFVDGVQQSGSNNQDLADSGDYFHIGKIYSDKPPYLATNIDHVTLFSYPLDNTEIKRYSERRYPV